MNPMLVIKIAIKGGKLAVKAGPTVIWVLEQTGLKDKGRKKAQAVAQDLGRRTRLVEETPAERLARAEAATTAEQQKTAAGTLDHKNRMARIKRKEDEEARKAERQAAERAAKNRKAKREAADRASRKAAEARRKATREVRLTVASDEDAA